jgi:hypothetical protein
VDIFIDERRKCHQRVLCLSSSKTKKQKKQKKNKKNKKANSVKQFDIYF